MKRDSGARYWVGKVALGGVWGFALWRLHCFSLEAMEVSLALLVAKLFPR